MGYQQDLKSNTSQKPVIFISYSHEDSEWKDRLRPHLELLKEPGQLVVWDDRKIEPTQKWWDSIKDVMKRADVAVCLISSNYLSSSFCVKEEIPYLLERAEHDGMLLLFVLIRACAWKEIPWLRTRQILPRDGKSVAEDFKHNWDTIFCEIAEIIGSRLSSNHCLPSFSDSHYGSLEDKQIEIKRLPQTDDILFGRQRELMLLDNAWKSARTNVISLVASGGVGKSTLVNRWLKLLRKDNWGGAKRIFCWSFHNQGCNDQSVSADEFLVKALGWFGDPEPVCGSYWAKGERLASLISRERTILILDGIESLQWSKGPESGCVRDVALATLIAQLAVNNPGLCVITSRNKIKDLDPFPETTWQMDLDYISLEAGQALLRTRGIRGDDADLKHVSQNFGRHALALNLLASWIRQFPDRSVTHAAKIPDLSSEVSIEQGLHPRRVLKAFVYMFSQGPEIQLMYLLGIFDRPADGNILRDLRKSPSIENLTDRLVGMSDKEWLELVTKLRRLRIIAPEKHGDDETLDAHPIIREHFRHELKEQFLSAWVEGNRRVYDYLKRTSKKNPKKIEEMVPLYAAIAHGCAAGRYQNALNDVFWRRIRQSETGFSIHHLGTTNEDLVALSNFFEKCWDRPVKDLPESDKGFVLYEVGFILRALGKLMDAVEPIRMSLEIALQQGDWPNAAIRARNLAEVHMFLGELEQADVAAQQAVELANCTDGKETKLDMPLMELVHLACIKHQIGKLDDAQKLFSDAEILLNRRSHEYFTLCGLALFKICEFLLDLGQYNDVKERVERALQFSRRVKRPLDIGLEMTMIGSAYIHLEKDQLVVGSKMAATLLDDAVLYLKQAGAQQYLPRGLLARAYLKRLRFSFDDALKDLWEAEKIAERGQMKLYLTDIHLELARLYIDRGELSKARGFFNAGRRGVEGLGYHRRDREVAELHSLFGS